MVKRVCGVCGKEFSIPFAWIKKGCGKFCSVACYNTTKSKKIETTCKVCGKSFYYKHMRPSEFCSRKCYTKNNQISKNCTVCGKTFTVPKSNADRYNTCGLACSRKYTIYGMKCKQCGKELGTGKDKFCSTSCYRKYTGETSPEKNVRLCLEHLGVDYIQEHTFEGWQYSVDFFLPKFDIVIEIDGEYWHNKPSVRDRDKRKTKWLESKGHKVFRISDAPFYGKITDKMVNVIRELFTYQIF